MIRLKISISVLTFSTWSGTVSPRPRNHLRRPFMAAKAGGSPAKGSHPMPQHQVHDVDGRCPVCSAPMTVTRLACGQCGTALDGVFRLAGAQTAARGADGASRGSGPLYSRADVEARFGRLARLDRVQLEFVETFLLCRG